MGRGVPRAGTNAGGCGHLGGDSVTIWNPYQSRFQPFEQKAAISGGPRTLADPIGVVIAGGSGDAARYAVTMPDADAVRAIDALVRARAEWMAVPGTADMVRTRAVDALHGLGLDAGAIEQLARAGVLEVSMPERAGAAARDFPWEFVLAEATRPYRSGSGGTSRAAGVPFLVYRRLVLDAPRAEAAAPRAPSSFLVVESAPAGLRQTYDFESERRLVAAGLRIEQAEPCQDPTYDDLVERVKADGPDVIHLAGVDTRLGERLVDLAPGSGDGMLMTSSEGAAEAIVYPRLAKGLVAGSRPPVLVTFNFYNSCLGAAAVVEAGADAAIGFHDEIDDSLAELFLARFYSEWRGSGWDLLRGFHAAWLNMAPHAAKIRGTGIVLWSRRSLLDALRWTTAPKDSARASSTGGATVSGSTASSRRLHEGIHLPDTVKDWTTHLNVVCEVPKQLNYSLLHNNRNILEKLSIKRQTAGIYKGISVEVRVSAGAQEAAFKTTINLDHKTPKEDLEGIVRVPLTSSLIRTLDESMFSTLYVAVKWGRHVLFERTERISFTPVDEWKYDDANGRWLPSFVFSRDPIVREIVDRAQRYLVALRDDSSAGFDGYQSFDPDAATIDAKSAAIDAQVQAIWWSIVYEYSLGYINPPPSFTDEAQRLRTPSEVVSGKRGTCIDLMLLLAACFEYIEVYPVLFLLNDHAFPGYWRSDDSYAKWGQILTGMDGSAPSEPTAVRPGSGNSTADSKPDIYAGPWMLGRSRFADVVSLVRDGHIVPIESVSLTSRSGFWPAVDEGLKNLRSKRQFHSLFDVRTARSKGVTPIPIWSKRI
jgi:hypothetical protein